MSNERGDIVVGDATEEFRIAWRDGGFSAPLSEQAARGYAGNIESHLSGRLQRRIATEWEDLDE